MKTRIFLLFFISICFSNCLPTDEEILILGTWDLTEVTGGFAGTQQNYNPGDILWIFEEDIVRVEDNIASTVNEYPYTLVSFEDNLFLVGDFGYGYTSPISFHLSIEISDTEIYMSSQTVLTISQNGDLSAGPLLDGFNYRLER